MYSTTNYEKTKNYKTTNSHEGLWMLKMLDIHKYDKSQTIDIKNLHTDARDCYLCSHF